MVAKYIINRCNELLLSVQGLKLILVFDGKRIPLKKDTNELRDATRKKNLIIARNLKRLGKRKEASEKYQSCIKFTKDMCIYVAQKVQEWNKVKICFSPFEADAQLAYLCKCGMADAVITEDSDVLVYSAACGNNFPIVYKLDRNSGNCQVYSMAWIDSPNSIHGDKVSNLRFLAQQESRHKNGRRMFVQVCVLAGNDYTNGISGVGIKGAFQRIQEQFMRKPNERFSFVLARSNSKDEKELEEKFAQIEAIFHYHYVRSNTQEIVSLMDPGSSNLPDLDRFDKDLSFLGDPKECDTPLITSTASSINKNSLKRLWSETKSSFFSKKQKIVTKSTRTSDIMVSSNEKSEEEEMDIIVSSLQTSEKAEPPFASFTNPYKDQWISKTNHVTPSPHGTIHKKEEPMNNEAKVDLFRSVFNQKDKSEGVFPYDNDAASSSPEKKKAQENPKGIEIIDLTPSVDSSITLFYDNSPQDKITPKNENTKKLSPVVKKPALGRQPKKVIRKVMKKKVSKNGQKLKSIQSFFKPVQK